MKNGFKKNNCEFKNESACEEELEEDGLDFEEEEGKEFGE